MIFVKEIHSENELRVIAVGVHEFAEKLHKMLIPFEDSVSEIAAGVEYALDQSGYRGGFILAATENEEIQGALVLLNTNMKGYVPENLLLYVAVDSTKRGKGIGSKLIKKAIELCQGDIKLHVEYDNPARSLYQRIGFISKYADMRYTHE